MIGAAIDEGGAAVLDHQVGGIETRAHEAGIDDVDAWGLGHGCLANPTMDRG